MLLRRPTLKDGFSMTELVIYMAVVGVLSMVIVPNFLSYLEKSKKMTTEATLGAVKNAIQSFHSDTGRYPESLQDLTRTPYDDVIAKRWEGPYLQLKSEDEEPLDGWKNELVYNRLSGEDKPFELYSLGKNADEDDEQSRIYA